MVRFEYGNPRDFDKNDGVNISKSDIQKMVDECANRLKDSKDWFTYEMTGNTGVIAIGYANNHGEEMDEINVYVFKNYEEAQAWKNKHGEWEKLDWMPDETTNEDDLEDYSHEELVDLVRKYRQEQYYNPRREV